MYRTIFFQLLFFLFSTSVVQAQDIEKIHQDMIVVDGHNDVIINSIFLGRDIGTRLAAGHTDIPRLQKGGVDVLVFAVWSYDLDWKKGAFNHANEQIDTLEKVVARNSDRIAIARSSADIDRILKEGKIVAIIGVEGGNMIESSIHNVEKLHSRGVKYLTLTWNFNLPWVTAAAIEDSKPTHLQKGLSKKGRKIIRRMNELGMMVDLSHASKKTFYDVIETTTKPILVSHSNAAALAPHFRNLDDDQLAALKENGGVIGVNFYSEFVDSTYNQRVATLFEKQFHRKPANGEDVGNLYNQLSAENKHFANTPLSKLIDHIDYLVKKVGIEHVALGSDFDGINSPPQDLEDVSKFPNITKALLERGYATQDIAKIMGLNFLRILKENEQGTEI
jgi:membrane dipeptidase